MKAKIRPAMIGQKVAEANLFKPPNLSQYGLITNAHKQVNIVTKSVIEEIEEFLISSPE